MCHRIWRLALGASAMLFVSACNNDNFINRGELTAASRFQLTIDQDNARLLFDSATGDLWQLQPESTNGSQWVRVASGPATARVLTTREVLGVGTERRRRRIREVLTRFTDAEETMASRILSWLLALLFVVAGVPKLIGSAEVVAAFQHMGYSTGFRILIGVLEVGGGIALAIPALTLYAAAVLIVIMIGAIWSVLQVGESFVPPLAVGVLLAVLATLRLRQSAGQRHA